MRNLKFLFTTLLFFFISFGLSAQNLDTDGDGKVGVGTSNSLEQVHLQSGSNYGLTFRSTPGGWGNIGNNYKQLGGSAKISTGYANILQFSSNGDVRFRASNDNSASINGWINQLHLYQNGSIEIGLGESNLGSLARKNGNFIQGYKLFVGEGILTEKLKVATVGSSNWADYVFEKDYKLNSIAEVEAHIKANKHLPNVPSAKEVEANGVDMVEMDATLLRQIEELWLHTIQLNKEKEQLQKENSSLSTQLQLLQEQMNNLQKQVSKLETQTK